MTCHPSLQPLTSQSYKLVSNILIYDTLIFFFYRILVAPAILLHNLLPYNHNIVFPNNLISETLFIFYFVYSILVGPLYL